MTAELQEQSRGESDYAASLRATFRALWLDLVSYDAFFQAMMVAIRRGLTQAFADGAKECGVLPEEFTPVERMELEQRVFDQYNYIGGLAEFIASHSKAQGGKWGAMSARVPLWANRYREAREKAKGMACADKKAQWIYGDTIEHCKDCSRVVGRVYRLSTWDKYGWIPGSHELACGGWRCKCQRVPTDAPCTPGRPPSLSGG